MYRKICIIITETFLLPWLSRRLLATLFRRRFRWSSGHRPPLMPSTWCASTSLGSQLREVRGLAQAAFFHQKLTRHALRWTVVAVAFWCYTKGENANLCDCSLDSQCAAGGAMATVYVQEPCHIFPFSRLAPIKLISTSKPSLIDEIRKAVPPVARLLQTRMSCLCICVCVPCFLSILHSPWCVASLRNEKQGT